MSRESPRRGIIQACGSKCLSQAGSELIVDLIDSGLDVICNSLQGIEGIDVIHGFCLGIVHLEVVIQDRLVVDDAVRLEAVCNRCNLAIVVDGQ